MKGPSTDFLDALLVAWQPYDKTSIEVLKGAVTFWKLAHVLQLGFYSDETTSSCFPNHSHLNLVKKMDELISQIVKLFL